MAETLPSYILIKLLTLLQIMLSPLYYLQYFLGTLNVVLIQNIINIIALIEI